MTDPTEDQFQFEIMDELMMQELQETPEYTDWAEARQTENLIYQIKHENE